MSGSTSGRRSQYDLREDKVLPAACRRTLRGGDAGSEGDMDA